MADKRENMSDLTQLPSGGRQREKHAMKIYRDAADWWIGVYLGPNHVYVCLLPTLVFRFDRKTQGHG